MAENIEIKLFDGFTIEKGGKQILENLGNTRKTKLFVAYLLVNRDRAISHQELFELLWSGEDYANPGTALRTLLYRFRSMLDKEGADQLSGAIISRRGTYQWNRDLNISIDVLDFEELAKAGMNQTVSEKRRRECLKKAIELYKGSPLPDFQSEPWMVAKTAHYRDLYVDVVASYIAMLKEEKQYQEIVSLCEKAIVLAGACELLELELELAKGYLSGSGFKGSGNLSKYYGQVIEINGVLREAINRLQEDLEADTVEQNAFICDYRVFKEIYHLQRRSLARTKRSMFLGIVDVKFLSEDVNEMDALKYERIMTEITQCCARQLRCGDAICRKDDSQLAILFPSESYEDAVGVLERLKSGCKEKTGEDTVIVYRLRPLKNAKE